jgi:hypothetical protein
MSTCGMHVTFCRVITSIFNYKHVISCLFKYFIIIVGNSYSSYISSLYFYLFLLVLFLNLKSWKEESVRSSFLQHALFQHQLFHFNY